jgi:DNA-binding NtrC family response regulator
MLTAKLADSDLLALPIEERARIRLLIVENDRRIREGLMAAIRSEGYAVFAVDDGAQAVEALKRAPYDIVLTDLEIGPVSGLDVLRSARQARRETIVIVITASPSISSSIEALRAGASDYLPKPFSATHLQVVLGRAAHAVLQTRTVRELREQVERLAGRNDPIALIGTSPAIGGAVDLARKVAPTDASVFLVGESGTGKELFAHFIHEHSRRASQPFVAINCAAMPEPLLESEMFGYRKGAFTGAEREKQGLLESAHGGTLLLDELSEMPIGVQAKLLRVLQDGVIRRVGSEHSDAIVDVRFISAMNQDPQEAVAVGKLRADLLYRLRVFPIRIPPLRERRADIPVLATHFLANAWIRHRTAGTTIPKLTTRSLQFLSAQPWRGNVRELRNVIEHVVVLADAGQDIDPEHIPVAQHARDEEHESSPAFVTDVLRETFHTAKERFVSEFERAYVRRLVDSTGGNLARAARIANVDRTTLYRLLEKHNVGVRRAATGLTPQARE